MIKPTCFFLNEETFGDNKFMERSSLSRDKSTKQAIKEFDNMVKNLRANGITVQIEKQMRDELPDSVFPNNWISTHKVDIKKEGGLFITYPMKAK